MKIKIPFQKLYNTWTHLHPPRIHWIKERDTYQKIWLAAGGRCSVHICSVQIQAAAWAQQTFVSASPCNVFFMKSRETHRECCYLCFIQGYWCSPNLMAPFSSKEYNHYPFPGLRLVWQELLPCKTAHFSLLPPSLCSLSLPDSEFPFRIYLLEKFCKQSLVHRKTAALCLGSS